MIDIQKLAETVQQMRTAQKEYFRTRSSIALAQSKKLERETDDMINSIIKSPLPTQNDMFGKPLPVMDPELKHEIKFCLLQDMQVNDHGNFIYSNGSGSHSINMPYFLSDYRDFLKTQGLTKDFQRA